MIALREARDSYGKHIDQLNEIEKDGLAELIALRVIENEKEQEAWRRSQIR